MINPARIFCQSVFLYLPKRPDWLTVQTRNTAINGNRIPLAICANLMTCIGLKPSREKRIPIAKMRAAVNLNLGSFKLDLKPKTPAAT